MAKKIFGVDFGTNVIKVYKKGEGIILLERTAVSTVGKGKAKRAIAIGEKSFEMFEKAPPRDKRFRARKRSVIASFI